MTKIQKQLKAYNERRAYLEGLRAGLQEAEIDHRNKTLADFGIADHVTATIPTMIDCILKVIAAKNLKAAKRRKKRWL